MNNLTPELREFVRHAFGYADTISRLERNNRGNDAHFAIHFALDQMGFAREDRQELLEECGIVFEE